MDFQTARVTMTGYMAPRNDAINQFAQRGVVSEKLIQEIDREIDLVDTERQTANDARVWELDEMRKELIEAREAVETAL